MYRWNFGECFHQVWSAIFETFCTQHLVLVLIPEADAGFLSNPQFSLGYLKIFSECFNLLEFVIKTTFGLDLQHRFCNTPKYCYHYRYRYLMHPKCLYHCLLSFNLFEEFGKHFHPLWFVAIATTCRYFDTLWFARILTSCTQKQVSMLIMVLLSLVFTYYLRSFGKTFHPLQIVAIVIASTQHQDQYQCPVLVSILTKSCRNLRILLCVRM